MKIVIRHKLTLIKLLVIFCNTLFAQDNAIESIKNQFSNIQSQYFPEKVFVHTDKTFYLAGESIWFKIYNVDGYFHQPFQLSKIGYAEVLDKNGKAILQARISLEEGTGSGSFIIPSYLPSGKYLLRAYTSWMRNFNPGYYFEQPLSIVNSQKKAPQRIEGKKQEYSVRFFPEGGNLVAGLSSRVACQVQDQHGKGVSCAGKLVDQRGSTIAEFKTDGYGISVFSFTPGKAAYSAIIKINDSLTSAQLPAIYNEGFVMRLEEMKDKVSVTIHANTTNDNNQVYLLVHTRQLMKEALKAQLLNGAASFLVEKEKLGDGISSFTVFNASRQPVCERLYFKKPNKKLQVDIAHEKEIYQKRQKIVLSISTEDLNGSAVMANLSASFFMIDSFQTVNIPDIQTYLFLNSDLAEHTQIAETILNNPAETSGGQDIDNLMLTQGWRRFKWEDVLRNNKPYFQFLPEKQGIIINGKVTNAITGESAPNVEAWLSATGENFQLAHATSNQQGFINFNIRNFYSRNNLLIQAGNTFKLKQTPAFDDRKYNHPIPNFIIPEQWKNLLLVRSINMQAENAYLTDQKQRSFLYNLSDTSTFYGKPDQRYFLDDYTRFITMEEVMKEYVADVRVRKENNQFYFRVRDAVRTSFFNNDPLILLDGVPVSASQIMEFNPLKVKKLEVVSRRYYLGNIVTDGIVSYTTFDLAPNEIPLNPGSVVIESDGIQRQREFYSPIYETTNQLTNSIPDFRNVLYWQPQIITDKTGKTTLTFYTGDLTGKFACNIQGISKNGLAGSNTIVFEVK